MFASNPVARCGERYPHLALGALCGLLTFDLVKRFGASECACIKSRPMHGGPSDPTLGIHGELLERRGERPCAALPVVVAYHVSCILGRFEREESVMLLLLLMTPSGLLLLLQLPASYSAWVYTVL